MAVIQIKIPSPTQNISTFVSSDYTTGTALSVENGGAFANANYIVVGEVNNEETEATSVTAVPTDTGLTIVALKFPHNKGTPVYYTPWDKYSLEYRTSDAGAWTAYPSMPVDLRWDALNTEYRDSAATSTYSWRYRYYSTEKTAYSDYSDIISATGWGDTTVGYMIRNIRKIINDPESKTITNEEVLRFLNAAQDKIYAMYNRWWFLFKEGTAINTVASTSKYSLPSDFGRMHSLVYNYVSGSTDVNYPLKYISLAEFDYFSRDNNATDDDELIYYTILPGDSTNATGYIKVWPKPDTAGLHLTPRYYKTLTDLDTFGDTTEVPIPSILEDYVLAQIYKIRKEEDKATYYQKSFVDQLELLKLMQNKQAGPPRYLWKYKGRHAMERLYGNSTGSVIDVENDF